MRRLLYALALAAALAAALAEAAYIAHRVLRDPDPQEQP